MKLLIKAALKSKKHFFLGLFVFVSLLFLTTANYMERCSLGILANTGISTSADKNPLQKVFQTLSYTFHLEGNFTSLIVILIFVAIYKAIWLFTSSYSTQILSIRISRDLRLQFFEHIQFLPMSFYNDYNMGALTSRAVSDAGQISSSLNSFITNYLQSPFTICSALLGCFYLSWQLSLVIFIGMPLVIIPVIVLTKKVKKVARQLQKNQESFISVLLDFLGGIHTIKIFAMEKFTRDKYKEENDKMAYLESKSAKYSQLTRPMLHLVTTSCMVAVVLFGLYSLHMTIAQLIVFVGILHLFYEPVKKFAEENANIQRGAVAAERMFQVLNLESHTKDGGTKALEGFSNKIEFENISFKYKDKWVLKDLSFEIRRGETVAIIGPTGSGKSTIVQLLPRLFDVQKGNISIDGIAIQEYTLKSLREIFAFVPQKPFLFYDTVSENISFGRSFSLNLVEEAAKKAHAHEFIINLPQKYETVLAEMGKTLSGGQQQRLAIARALIKKAPILIMDEATSSLDAISENRIKMAIDELRGQITQIIIAHRLSTIENADKIIYIEQGRKVAEGTKEELLKNSKEFCLMWDNYHKSQAKSLLGDRKE